MEEEWRDVVGYEGLYQVSNLGRVKSLFRYKKILKGVKTNTGYLRIALCKNGKMKLVSIHRLVANAFVYNPNNYPCVNHKDEIRINNRADNLEWCTHKYNSNYGNCREKIRSKCTHKPIRQIKDNKIINTFSSIKEATDYLGKHKACGSNIISVCKKKKESAYGFKWEYVN